MQSLIKPLTGIALAALLFAAHTAHAQTTVFSTFLPGNVFDTQSYYTDYGPLQQIPPDYTYQSIGFTFTPSASGSLSGVTIALSSVSNVRNLGRATDAHIFLSQDNGGIPGALLESFTLASLPDTGTNYAPEVVTSALHPVLMAGTTYDLYVAEPGNEANVWNLSSTGIPDAGFDSNNPNSQYYPLTIRPGAFSIQEGDAPVPEASTTVSFGLLLALGLDGVVIAAKKKKAASQAA